MSFFCLANVKIDQIASQHSHNYLGTDKTFVILFPYTTRVDFNSNIQYVI